MYKEGRKAKNRKVMSKIISVNPDLFKVTKKKRSTNNTSIRPRPPSAANNKNKTARRNHVLKFIRNEQEKNYRKLLEGDAALQARLLGVVQKEAA